MPALGFTDQRARMRRILENALNGALYDSSESEEDGRMVVLHGHRPGGALTSVRFRAVESSEATVEPEAGAPMTIHGVDVASSGCLSLLGFVIPSLRSPGQGYTRVRIDIGAARLEIVCQDAEWWEDPAPAGQA